MPITKDDILLIPAFKIAFEHDHYKDIKDEFIKLINDGSQLPVFTIIKLLLAEYINNIRISRGYRTIYFDFAWAILEISPQLWADDEKRTGVPLLTDHIKNYFPDYNESSADDIAMLEDGEYLTLGFEILNGDVDSYELKAAYSYGMYVFFKNNDLIELENVIEAIENATENS